MKRVLVLLILLCSCLQLTAQQRPQYTQYIFNNFLLNPALSGIENYTDVKAGYRSQWQGLQGAPVTSYLTINAPLGSDFIQGDPTEMPAAGEEDPASRSYVPSYAASPPHHGIGFMIVSDKAGQITETNIDATYAYHIGLTSNLNLALGVSGGVTRSALDLSQVTLGDYSRPDFAVLGAGSGYWAPDLGVGVWAYSALYYVGASVQQLLPQDLFFNASSAEYKLKSMPQYSGEYQSKSVPQYFFTAGYKLFLSDDVTLLPSILLKEIKPVPFTYDVNVKISFRDRFWIGGSYRHNDSFGFLTGFNISSLINVGYSYDVTSSALNTVSNGTHEIVLGILLNNRYNVPYAQHQF